MLRYCDSGTFVSLIHTQNVHPENVSFANDGGEMFAYESRFLFRGRDFPFYSWDVVGFHTWEMAMYFCVPSTGIITGANSPDS
jgi:hypothetical protein